MRNMGRAVTREQIAEQVWKQPFDPASNIVDVYVSYLRQKIDDPGRQPFRPSAPPYGPRHGVPALGRAAEVGINRARSLVYPVVPTRDSSMPITTPCLSHGFFHGTGSHANATAVKSQRSEVSSRLPAVGRSAARSRSLWPLARWSLWPLLPRHAARRVRRHAGTDRPSRITAAAGHRRRPRAHGRPAGAAGAQPTRPSAPARRGVARVRQMGVDRWIARQLDPQSIDDGRPTPSWPSSRPTGSRSPALQRDDPAPNKVWPIASARRGANGAPMTAARQHGHPRRPARGHPRRYRTCRSFGSPAPRSATGELARSHGRLLAEPLHGLRSEGRQMRYYLTELRPGRHPPARPRQVPRPPRRRGQEPGDALLPRQLGERRRQHRADAAAAPAADAAPDGPAARTFDRGRRAAPRARRDSTRTTAASCSSSTPSGSTAATRSRT